MIAVTPFRKIALAGAVLSALGNPAAFADDASWSNNASSTWATGSNWDTGNAPGDTTGTTNQDTATFSMSVITASRTVTTDTDRNIKNITIDVEGYTGGSAYTVGGAAGSLLLTSGGTLQLTGAANRSGSNYSAAAVNPTSMVLQGNYTFSANATNSGTGGIGQFYIGGAATVSGASGLGAVTLTLSGSTVANTIPTAGDPIASSSGGVVNGKIVDGSESVVSVVKEGAGAWQFANNNNTFSGGVTIKQGTIVTNQNNGLGTGGVTLGENASAQNATLLISSNNVVANSVTVNAGSGLRTLGTNAQSNDATYSGTITLNGGAHLRLQKASANGLIVSGGITGAGDVEVYNNANAGVGANKGIVFSTTAINNAGTVTNASPGVGTLTQTEGGIIGSNVTEFIQNSATSTTTLSLANAYGATTILAGTLATTDSGTLGTGNVTVNGGSLILGSSISLSDTAILSFIDAGPGTISLNNLDADTVYAIYDITTGTYAGVDTWTAAELNDFFGTSVFTGDGQLTTLAAVPEPGTMGLALFAALGLAFCLRRRPLQPVS